MRYTKQDVFRHNGNGRILIFNFMEDDGDCQFSGKDDVDYWNISEVEYLGRSLKILLHEEVKLHESYYVVGCTNIEFKQKIKVVAIDGKETTIPYQIINNGVTHWCRHLLEVPFDEIEDVLFFPKRDSVKIEDDINSTIDVLVKQPKPLL